jgi:hypothetical protein
MCKFTTEQKQFIIKTVLSIQKSKKKLSIKNDLMRIYNQNFPDSSATFDQIYRCFKNRPKIKV